jgi:hypothetical protein
VDDWHVTYLGRRRIPRDLTAFELEAFFSFTATERREIAERRGPALRLGLALQVGFLRISGRLLDAIGVVPPMLWRHSGEQFGIAGPELASLRVMYRRHRTLFEHQEAALSMVGFRWLGAAERRAIAGARAADVSCPPSSSATSRPRGPRGSTCEASSASRSSATPSSSFPRPGARKSWGRLRHYWHDQQTEAARTASRRCVPSRLHRICCFFTIRRH